VQECQVMVVDDSRAMRGILRRMLEESGYQVREASHGREALDRLRAGEQVDLVLVDWNMPEMNGYDFVTAIRSDAAFASLRLVMVTTETELHQVQRALEAGANEYVMKPFTREVLVEKLALVGLGNGL
jgi:two-component system chemotaxis response regulator CheY